MRFIYLLSIIPFFAASQNCNICPPGPVNLVSTFSPTAAHQWTCTNGFTSTLVNPTFAPIADVTCNLLVTENNCTSTSQTIIDLCDCDCNTPCITASYNYGTDCVTVAPTGSSCSPVATDVSEWKNQFTSYAAVPVSNQLCSCDIYEYLNTSAACSIVGTGFRLQIDNLNAGCPTCDAGDLKIFYQFPVSSNSVTSSLFCGQTSDWYSFNTLTPAFFASAGSQMDAYVTYITDFGTVVNHYRFTYNGGGLSCANITIQEVQKGKIYKDITVKRTVTYTDGCHPEVCEYTLDIPQIGNDPCYNFTAYMNSVNLSAPCSGSGLSAVQINGTAPLTYQWTYNNTNIAGNTAVPNRYCLVGAATGVYCCVITDALGCTTTVCGIVQPPCSLGVVVTAIGTALTANLTNCVGSPTYQWQRFNGTTWITVGSASTFNTGGLAGDYRVNVTCGSCTAVGLYTYIPPCTASVSLVVSGTNLVGTVTGCGGTSITYVWEILVGTNWTTVATVTTASTSNTYTPTVSGNYRLTITCGSCTDNTTINYTAPSPCTGFISPLTGIFTNMCQGTTRTFGRTTTGGTAPFTQVWTINGSGAGTGTTLNFTAATLGNFAIGITVTDVNGCVFTDTRNITVVTCCGMTASVTPTTISVCTNQDATFTASQTGGTAPINYAWTSQLLPASAIAQGSGTTKTLNFSTAGSYTVVVTATDNTGCTSNATATMTVTTCTNCVCTHTLTLSGCILTGTFNGAGCGNYSYQLQYSLTGTGWSTVTSGLAAPSGSFSYTPTANGFYRVVILSAGCTLAETPLVSVTCFTPTCSNSPTLTLNSTSSTVCGTTPVTVIGNIFGGSATSVTITENGAGTVTPTSSGASPFSFTYTPSLADAGTTLTVTVVTNNPLGAPCTPETRLYSITVNPIPTPTITSSNTALCVGQTKTLTATPAGGVFTVSGPATVAGGALVATGAGNIIVTYTVTALGCVGSATQTIVSNSLPTAVSATVSCMNGVGTVTVTSPLGAGLEYSLDGVTYQTSPIFPNVGNGSSITVRARNAAGCITSTSIAVSCSDCGCTASIAITSNCTLALTQACTGYAWTWQESLNGTSGWAQVQTSGSTFAGVSGRFYRVVLTKALCADVITNILNPICPCLGLTMTISPVTGGVSFGTLNFNGVPITNYQIQWRKCSDNSVILTSGMGTGAGAGIYPHPSSNIPLVGDCYYAQIITSDQGNNLNCFSQFNVANWTCVNPPTYNYNGPGGAAATREFRMDIAASTNIRVANFYTETVPDLLEIIYNGITLYSSTNTIYTTTTPATIPITYVVGQNYITFRVTNSLTTSNTIWRISNVTCCSSIVCPTVADVRQITSISAALNATCGCTLTPTYTNNPLNCSGCGEPGVVLLISTGGCTWNQSTVNLTCYNETVIITKLAGASRSFDFATGTNYNIVKSAIQSVVGDQRIRLQFHSATCGNDGTIIQYDLLPTYHTIVFDDVNYTITITIPLTNPFLNTCANCDAIKFTLYNQAYALFNTSSYTGAYQSIRYIQKANATLNSVNAATFSSIINCAGGTCGPNLDRRYRLSYRNTTCPCQSWELHEDTDDNGTYETLVLQEAGWTGACN